LAFEGEMRSLGYLLGGNAVLEVRLVRPNTSDTAALATDLARIDLAVVVAGALPHALALRGASPVRPLVVAT